MLPRTLASPRILLGLAAASFALLAALPSARADILQLSATGFVSRGVTSSQDGENAGMLINATGQYYSIVPFSVSGNQVCRFSLWYRDFDNNHNVTARLLRKRVAIGANAFAAPVVMAQVSSSGAIATMQRATTTIITSPTIRPAAAIYYVDLDIPFSALQVVGVQIEHKPACP